MRCDTAPWCHTPRGDGPKGDDRHVFVSKKERSFFFFSWRIFISLVAAGKPALEMKVSEGDVNVARFPFRAPGMSRGR